MKLASLFVLASLLPALPASAQQIEVHLSPTCDCCKAWVRHLEEAGFTSRVVESQDMGASKRAFRVPDKVQSCHTGIVDGYFVEGHVPASDIRRLLKERPVALGLAVPTCRSDHREWKCRGSHRRGFQTLLVGADGRTTVYGNH